MMLGHVKEHLTNEILAHMNQSYDRFWSKHANSSTAASRASEQDTSCLLLLSCFVYIEKVTPRATTTMKHACTYVNFHSQVKRSKQGAKGSRVDNHGRLVHVQLRPTYVCRRRRVSGNQARQKGGWCTRVRLLQSQHMKRILSHGKNF